MHLDDLSNKQHASQSSIQTQKNMPVLQKMLLTGIFLPVREQSQWVQTVQKKKCGGR